MKYEEIKIGDVFTFLNGEVTVISKIDKYRFITTIDSDMRAIITWREDDLRMLEPIKEQLPEEGLLVSKIGSLAYKLSDGSGYGFALGEQSRYYFNKNWGFSNNGYWRKATPEQKCKFSKMLEKECEKRGLFEDTKIEKHADGKSLISPDYMGLSPVFTNTDGYSRNGRIFYKGKFAAPRKEDLLDKVTEVVNEFGNHIIEKTESGVIILTPIKK